jgi:hypothetical protein
MPARCDAAAELLGADPATPVVSPGGLMAGLEAGAQWFAVVNSSGPGS